MLRSDWKYYIDETEVFPSGTDRASIRYKHDDGEIFFYAEFDGELTFTGDDFQIIKTDYDLGDYCKQYDFYIEEKCNHKFQVKYIGFFSMLDGEFNLDRCTFKVKPTLIDKYSCLKKNEDVTIDILDDSVQRYVITSDCYTRIEFWVDSPAQEMDLLTTISGLFYQTTDSVCDDTRNVDIYAREAVILPENATPDNTWTEWDGGESLNSIEVPDYYKKWVRGLDYVTITPVGGDIIVSCDEYYMTDTTYAYQKEITQIVGSPPAVQIYKSNLFFRFSFLQTLYNLNATISYVNCIKLTDAINFAKDQCSGVGDLISDFFTNATNPVTGLASKVNNVYLIQKSDAKRPGASEQATVGETTWKDLMTAVQNYFNVRWYLNDDSDLVIEHISDIAKNTGIDVTVAPYTETTQYRRQFKFDKNLIYKYEQWNVSEAMNTDFKGVSIAYSDACSLKNGKYESKNYDLGDYVTDLGLIQSEPSKASDSGFVIVACDGSNKVINESGILSGRTELNGHLAISRLHDNYWKHDRIFLNGTMNGVATVFSSAQKLRQIEKLGIKLCCDVDFDPIDTINTVLGTANVESASFSLYTNKLDLDLYV